MWESENSFQRILEDALADVPYQIGAKVISEKLLLQGVQLGEPERQQLVEHLKTSDDDQWTLPGESPDVRVRVEITETDIEVIQDRLDEFMSEGVPEIIAKVGERAADEVLQARAKAGEGTT